MDNVKIFVQREWDCDYISIWCFEYYADKKYGISFDGSVLVKTEIPEASVGGKPLLRMPRHMAEIFFKGITEYLSKEGIRTDNDNLLLGQLEAKKEHLGDMQMIVKKLMKID